MIRVSAMRRGPPGGAPRGLALPRGPGNDVYRAPVFFVFMFRWASPTSAGRAGGSDPRCREFNQS